MAFVVDDIILSELILTFGPSVIDMVGGFFGGQVEQENFEKELGLKSKELDFRINDAADRRKIDRQTLKQDWQKFIDELKFKKESDNTKNVLKILEPEFAQSRRRKNILKAFSSLRSSAPAAAPAAPVAPVAPAAPTNALAP